MDTAKAHFLRKDLIPLLKSIAPDTPPQWGQMSLQQMIEHFAASVRMASRQNRDVTVITPEENLPRMQAYLMSDKPYPQNVRNPLLGDTPPPLRFSSLAEALNDVQAALDSFFETFFANPSLTTRNPFFGELNFDQNLQFVYKHAVHHLRQFGVEVKIEPL